MQKHVITLTLVFALFLSGCSSSSSTVTPELMDINTNPMSSDLAVLASGTLNVETGTVEFDSRSTSAYFNVNQYLKWI